MGLRRIIIARSRPLVGHDLFGKPVPTFPNHALADTAPRIELFVRQVAQSGVVGFVVRLDFRLVRTAFRACVRCMAADIGGAVDLALLRALSAHRGRRANDCRQGDASDQQSHRFTPYLSGAIKKSKLRAHPVSVSGAPIVSTKIGQIFSFVQSKVPNRRLSIRRGGSRFPLGMRSTLTPDSLSIRARRRRWRFPVGQPRSRPLTATKPAPSAA
jgi:hypothetical protein